MQGYIFSQASAVVLRKTTLVQTKIDQQVWDGWPWNLVQTFLSGCTRSNTLSDCYGAAVKKHSLNEWMLFFFQVYNISQNVQEDDLQHLQVTLSNV